MTKTLDAREDLIGGLRPLERLRALVREVDVATDGHLEFAGAAVEPLLELLLGRRGTPPLTGVQPRAAGRREVDMKAGMPQQPAMNPRRFVGARVVDDQVDVERRRHRPVDGPQELTELAGPVALMELAEDFAA